MTKAHPIQLQQGAWDHSDRGDLPAATAALEQAIGLFLEGDEALQLSRQARAAYEANCQPDHPDLIA